MSLCLVSLRRNKGPTEALSVKALYHYAECRYAECRGAQNFRRFLKEKEAAHCET